MIVTVATIRELAAQLDGEHPRSVVRIDPTRSAVASSVTPDKNLAVAVVRYRPGRKKILRRFSLPAR